MTKLTLHASTRKQQRGFLDSDMDMIIAFGKHSYAPGNTTEISFGDKEYWQAVSELKQRIQRLEKIRGKSVILSDDGLIITCQIKKNRIRRG